MDLPQSTPASHQGYHHTSLCRTAGQGLLLPDLHPLPTPLHPLCIPPHHLRSDSPHPGTETGGKEIAQGLDDAIPCSRFSVLLDVRQFWHKQPVPPSVFQLVPVKLQLFVTSLQICHPGTGEAPPLPAGGREGGGREQPALSPCDGAAAPGGERRGLRPARAAGRGCRSCRKPRV